jgi:HK97 family phage major capsid protein
MATKAAKYRDQINERIAQARALAEKAETEGRDFNDEERAGVKRLFDEAKALAADLKAVAADDEALAGLFELGKGIGTDEPRLPALAGEGKSTGARFVDGVADYLKQVIPTSGRIPEKARISTPAVGFKGLDDLTGRGAKAILTGTSDTQAGALITAQRLGILDFGALQREVTLLDVITRGETGSDAVEYARVTGFTNNAAPTAEAAGVQPFVVGAGNVEGAKPQSDMTLVKITETVKTVAHWMPATKRALSDAAQLRTLIDNFLLYGLNEELEDQIVSGDGNGENFEGILGVSGVQAQAFDTDLITSIRKAITKVRVNGKASANAVALHPNDDERLDLTKDLEGRFYFGGPVDEGVPRIWRRPRVVSEAVPEGTAIVGDFRFAVLWDREDAAIQATDSHADFFIRNLVAILAELRAAFGILRPAAFCTVDLTAA